MVVILVVLLLILVVLLRARHCAKSFTHLPSPNRHSCPEVDIHVLI